MLCLHRLRPDRSVSNETLHVNLSPLTPVSPLAACSNIIKVPTTHGCLLNSQPVPHSYALIYTRLSGGSAGPSGRAV